MTGLSIALQPEPSTRTELAQIHAVIDYLSHGRGVLADLEPTSLHTLLSDLSGVLASLLTGARARGVVRLTVPRSAWDLGLERAGDEVLLTVYQAGSVPEVALHERAVGLSLLVARVGAAFEILIANADAHRADGLTSARDHLLAAAARASELLRVEATAVSVDPTGEVSVFIGADLMLREHPMSLGSEAQVQRSDLFSLLFRGRLRIALGEHARELHGVFVFLMAEQLVQLADGALSAWTQGRASHQRSVVGGAIAGVRVNPRGAAALTLGLERHPQGGGETFTFPGVDVGALVQGVLAFGRALARSVIRRDRSQAYNLRLVSFREKLREVAAKLRESTRSDAKVNEAPESYRAFAATIRKPRPSSDGLGHARLRFNPKWLATVPAIDLRATFLCGDALIVGATRETCCFDRHHGDIIWKRPMSRAVPVVTTAGLARLDVDGLLTMHELGTGEVAWTTRLTPRVGGGASGAVINAPGLPRLLLVSEGARHLAAVDLDAGEVRWRHSARRGAIFRMRRAGKLAIVASGEASLSALDVLTGEVVWRVCDRLRFASHVTVEADEVFAVAGGSAFVERGGSRLHRLDAWSGEAQLHVDLPARLNPVGAPLVADETVVLVTLGRDGTGLYGVDRRTGEVRFERSICAGAASCMLVDNLVIVNTESGELVGVDSRDGSVRYRHVFTSLEGDKPRRLEPVLRSGALFVPQSEVHVVRPGDGTVLGRIQTDLIPDLLRVDERCDVYVAEESGHLAAFAAGARLALVK